MPPTSQYGGRHSFLPLAVLAVAVALLAAVAMPSNASAASCPVTPGVFATAWIGGSGDLGAENWTNGTPTGSCDVTIASPGSDVITMTGGANMKSLTLGGIGSTPQLIISDQSPNTNLDAQPAGIAIAAGASVTLTCLPGGCPGGGPDIYSGPSPFVNAGTITVGPNTGGGAVVGGQIANTGTIDFDQSGSLGGKVTNQGLISVADGATATNSGSHCGDTGALVKNDTGGLISVAGTGTLSLRHYEQGAGTTSGATPVQLPCGSIKYSGNGASKVLATGGFALYGEMQAGQELTVSGESSNTNATLQENFTNKGSITLTCRQGSCGGVGFNAHDKDFVNAGIFTVAAAAATGTGLGSNHEGTVLNTGTIEFDQSAYLSGPVTNQGAIEIADEKIASSSGSSCGDTGASVKNDTGGSIEGTGSGHLSVLNYEQGAGTTSGAAPVRIPCGSLKYSGSGASVVQVNGGGTPMTGNVAAGQTLRLVGGISSGPFTNAGTIVFDQSASSPSVNAGTLTNTGKIELVGPSANTSSVTGGQLQQTGAGAEIVVPAGTKLSPGAPLQLKAGTLRGAGTIAGPVENSGGVLKPGDSPGTLTLTGSYKQDSGGRLEIEIAGTGAGQFDTLAVGGVATISGSLTLIPTGSFASSAAIGNSVAFLDYGTSFSGGFTSTFVEPSLSCPKLLTVSNDSGAKALKAVVTDSGSSCGGGGGGGGGGGSSAGTTPPAPVVLPPAEPPATKTCAKGKKLQKGRCVPRKCPKGKKLKKGRCVKKKKPKARSRQR